MLIIKKYMRLSLALCLNSISFASSEGLEEFKESDDNNVGYLWTDRSAIYDYQLSTICSEEEKPKALKILNSVDVHQRQTVLEDLQNLKKHKSKLFHNGINAFAKLIDDGENIFKSFQDFRYLLYVFMGSEIILSKNDLIARINKYFDKQLTVEDNT